MYREKLEANEDVVIKHAHQIKKICNKNQKNKNNCCQLQSYKDAIKISRNTKKLKGGNCAKWPYSEFFWSVFSRIRTEYGKIRSISPYSVGTPGNADQKNSEYGHLSRNG